VDPGLVAHADPAFVHRVVEALLSNVTRHTPDRAVAVLEGRQDGGCARVVVRDDGPGIPAAEVEHLGERFFRGGDINSRPRGLGLGLAVARELLRMHDARLEVDSAVGRGTAFSFALPMSVGQNGDRRPPPGRFPADGSDHLADG
jgi:signal transduction histidine kinase